MKKVRQLLVTPDLYFGLARYSLAGLMMSFGMLKILGMQFNTIRPFATWAQPLEHLSGQQLTWAFMGHSHSFQVIVGLFEFVPALLLLFRRTSMLGALLLLPMTAGVFLVNFLFGLWTNTRLDAAFMLAANVLILLPDGKRLRSMFTMALAGTRTNRVEVTAAILVAALAVLPRLLSSHYRNDKNELTGDWFNNGPYVYSLVDETENEQPLPHQNTSIFFGPNGEYSEVNDSLSKAGAYRIYTVDEARKTLDISITEYGPWKGSYYMLRDVVDYSLSGDTLSVHNGKGHSWLFVRRLIHRNQH